MIDERRGLSLGTEFVACFPRDDDTVPRPFVAQGISPEIDLGLLRGDWGVFLVEIQVMGCINKAGWKVFRGGIEISVLGPKFFMQLLRGIVPCNVRKVVQVQ